MNNNKVISDGNLPRNRFRASDPPSLAVDLRIFSVPLLRLMCSQFFPVFPIVEKNITIFMGHHRFLFFFFFSFLAVSHVVLEGVFSRFEIVRELIFYWFLWKSKTFLILKKNVKFLAKQFYNRERERYYNFYGFFMGHHGFLLFFRFWKSQMLYLKGFCLKIFGIVWELKFDFKQIFFLKFWAKKRNFRQTSIL